MHQGDCPSDTFPLLIALERVSRSVRDTAQQTCVNETRPDWPAPLVLNYKKFLYSCLAVYLAVGENFLNMLSDILNAYSMKHRRSAPHTLIFGLTTQTCRRSS